MLCGEHWIPGIKWHPCHCSEPGSVFALINLGASLLPILLEDVREKKMSREKSSSYYQTENPITQMTLQRIKILSDVIIFKDYHKTQKGIPRRGSRKSGIKQSFPGPPPTHTHKLSCEVQARVDIKSLGEQVPRDRWRPCLWVMLGTPALWNLNFYPLRLPVPLTTLPVSRLRWFCFAFLRWLSSQHWLEAL